MPAVWFFSSMLACTPDLTPTWAWDPIWLEGGEDGAVDGFQTWQLYGPKWAKRESDRDYVCAVVVRLAGEAGECDAPGCTAAWDLAGEVLETDCPDPTLAEAPLFLALERLALGGSYTGEDAAWPGKTSVGYADYGSGWEVHGTAYPEAYDLGGAADPTWTGEDPFLFTPDAAFPVP